MDNFIQSYNDTKEKLSLYTYYIIIGVVSILSLIFLPLVGSTLGLEWNLPNTKVGWIVYIVTKVIIATINVLIFHSFVCQGKVNVKQNEQFRLANQILNKIENNKERKPVSPGKFFSKLYISKGTTIFISSVLALVAFSQAIFSYNWQDLITYGFVIVMGIIFGVLTMLKVESYLTTEYLLYAQSVEEANKNGN